MGSWSGVGVGLGHSLRLSLSDWRCIKLESRCSSKFRFCGTVRQSVGLNSEYKVWGIQRKRVRVQGSGSWSCEEVMSLLEADLPRLFDEQGIDKSMYEKDVKFRDPITKHDSLDGYLFNISLLRLIFSPLFQLHSLKQTGPNDITTRWTMVMRFGLLPWRPELVFTGTTVMSINPETGKFRSHVDYWDSIKQNDYFSFEGLMDVIKQLRIFTTPDLETPKYQILKRTADYEVRKYEPFIVIETKGDKLTGSSGFNDVTGYIFGKNTKKEKIPMTTPVFTQKTEASSQVQIQVVLPLERKISEQGVPNFMFSQRGMLGHS
ncbi:uncharacterized protein LOC131065253 isoform X2 [Cryptomeria japonica]|uniref:uncharacterized protein LOC131065253 isoform X2 n=1 Tax=Cryptomeria japonica TaxID=3369 RepID=UPI0027DA5F72|nr:uncharacterized protein LOC131065253 isoform X2 [Cryptomeria japonica]